MHTQEQGRAGPPAAVATRLARGRVLVVGAGGLGVPAAMALAGAGIGTIGVIDGDRVEVSNLHRQILYRAADIGQPKATLAAQRIRAMHPSAHVVSFDEWLSEANAAGMLRRFDFVIDGTDTIAAKFLINDAALRARVPFSHAGVVGFEGQTLTVIPGRSACLRCLFPVPPAADEVPTCSGAGVVGPLVGAIGTLQAAEAIKFLTGSGDLLADRLLTVDLWRHRWRVVRLSRSRRCPVCA
jgi:molybdopterin/thiamine biosynthesis adenylyltransferase